MPKLVTYSSAGAPVMPIGMTPSMSFGVRPASATAASDASSCKRSALLSDEREYVVSATPTTEVVPAERHQAVRASDSAIFAL